MIGFALVVIKIAVQVIGEEEYAQYRKHNK